MSAQFAVNVKFNAGNAGVAHNVFYMEWNTVGSPPDSATLATANEWIGRVYAPLRDIMSNAYVGVGVRVDEVDDSGTIVRHVGTVSPTVSGNSGADVNSGPTAMTGTARTNIPQVRGSKRFPGIIDTNVVGQLLVNGAVARMAQAVGEWLQASPVATSFWRAGVMSKSQNSFIPFSNSGVVTNIPGTQVTRKPFRGA